MSGFSLTLTSVPADRDQLSADLWEAGTTGITEDEHWVRAFFDEGADADALMQQFAAYSPQYEKQEDYDWVQHVHSMWQPFGVGERFWLVPEWQDDPAPPGRMRIIARSGLAFGSGRHAATQLCMMALEQYLRPGMKVLDVGTGSGILAEASRLLGAGRVYGCDIDPEATLVAHNNYPQLPLFTGSMRSVRDASVDMIVANINAATIGNISKDLARVATGPIILSGFLEDEQVDVPRPAVQKLELDGWACIVC